MENNTTGYSNVAVGRQALYNNSAGGWGNNAIGNSAMQSNTNGAQNNAMGYGAMLNNTSGSYNQAIGSGSLNNNTIGNNNVGVGDNTLQSNVAGFESTAVGFQAMRYANNSATTFYTYNTALGSYALQGSTTASANTGTANTPVGSYALQANTTGNQNLALGAFSLQSNSTGSRNSAIGYLSLSANTTGGTNTGLGYMSAVANTTGGGNTALGYQSLYTNSVGNYNTAIGQWALTVATGSSNVGLGAGAGGTITTGNDNIAIGTNVANTILTTGSKNILIGANGAIDTPAAATSNFLNIGNTIFATNINTGTVAAPAGNVGIGTTTPSYPLSVVGDVNITGTYRVNGVALAAGGGSVTNVSSANADIAVATGSTTPVLTLNSGTGNNQIVKLTAAGKYPAVDGSLITNLSFSAFGTSTLPIANGGTNSSTPLNNNRLMASVGGAIVETAAMTNGQILIGSTGAAPVASTLTAGNGILIGNGAGTISPSVNAGITANKIPQVGGVDLPLNSLFMSNGTGIVGKTCNVNEILKWSSTDWVCSAITSSQWVTNSSDISYTTGKVGIGTTTPQSLLNLDVTSTSTNASDEQTMLITSRFNPTGSPGNRAGLNLVTSVPASNSTNLSEIRGIFSYAPVSGSGTVTAINGARLYGEYNGSSTVTELNGSLMGAGASTGNVTTLTAAKAFALNYGSNMTNMAGMSVETNNLSGTVTNRYSIILRSPGGAATNDFGVYQEGAGQKNYFAGTVGIGTTAPAARLDGADADFKIYRRKKLEFSESVGSVSVRNVGQW